MEELTPVISELPRMSNFYRQRSILVTGSSGFLGQVIVEKLLWTYPDIKTIYTLIRTKPDKSASQRLDEMINSDCFRRLRNRDASFRDKLVAVSGDISLPDLGLSQYDRSRILSEVSIIIHSAATVIFDEPLSKSVDINLLGTNYLLQFAMDIHHLDVFVHISTAYSNSNRLLVEEKMYEPLVEWTDFLRIREKVDPSVFNTLANKLKGNLPNNYTFIKNVTEHMVYENGDKIPIVIIRPPIVNNSSKDPCSGYCFNINGLIAVSLGASTGILRSIICKPEIKGCFVPCDFVACIVLYTAYLRHYQKKDVKPIYHTSFRDMNMSHYELRDHGYKSFKKYPPKYAIWYPKVFYTSNYWLYYIHFFLFQLIPALLVDVLLKLVGQKPLLTRIQKKIYNLVRAYAYFVSTDFIFNNSNLYFVDKFMNSEDKNDVHFAYKKEEFDFDAYTNNSFIYTKMKMLNQKPEDYNRALKLHNILYCADLIVKYGLLIYLVWYLHANNLITSIFSTTYSFITHF